MKMRLGSGTAFKGGKHQQCVALAFQNAARSSLAESWMLVSVLALLLYSLKFLSLPFQLRTLPVNLFLLLLLHLLLALELVSNQRTSSRSERTTDERPRNRMVNGTTDKTPRSSSPQRPDSCPFLRSIQTRAAQK